MYERLSLTNYGAHDVLVPLSLRYEADFRDMFEVRGSRAQQAGPRL